MAKATRPGKAPSAAVRESGKHAAKVVAFAPEQPGQLTPAEKELQALGCQVVHGAAGWHTPQGNSEGELVAMARGADALMGTSIRSTPITRAVMESAPDLRIVAKYTIGYDDVDVAAATELGVIVTHSPTEPFSMRARSR